MSITRKALSCTLVYLLVHLTCSLGDKPRNEACRGDNRDEFGFALLGHQYATISADNFGRCFTLCFKERCQSVAYLWDVKECQPNNETKTSKTADFVPHPASTYMENTLRAKKGSIALVPGLSCKDISVSGDAQGDGEYWIDPTASGDPFKVFCDMITSEGGWTLISRFRMINSNSTKDNKTVSNRYRKIISNLTVNHHFLLREGLNKLQQDMGFTQMRFYCFKKNMGRVFHIMTSDNSTGKSVVNFFTNSDTLPQACDSFTILPDDNSSLARNCDQWGFYEKNTWGHKSFLTAARLYRRPMVWPNPASLFYRMYSSGLKQCDDKNTDLSVGDLWQIFVK